MNFFVTDVKKHFVLFVLLFLLPCVSCCSSSKSKSSRTEVTNEIETFPSLFTTSASDLKNERTLCPKSYPLTSCKVVQVNIEALAAPKMNFPVLFSSNLTTPLDGAIILKKTTEEGLKMVLTDPTTPATATVTYKVESIGNCCRGLLVV